MPVRLLLYLNSQNLQLIFLFLTIAIFLSFYQFAYAQTAENEIIENTLETVDKITTEFLSENESVSNASKSITMSADDAQELSNNNASSPAFQKIENLATNVSKVTENSEPSITLKNPVNESLTDSIFENPEMGIKLKYPSIGHVDADREHSCHDIMCKIEIILNSSSERKITIESNPPTWYTKPNEERMVYDKHLKEFVDKTPKYTNDTLLDFAKDIYLDLIHPSFKYLNDSQISVSNHTAIQLEYIVNGIYTLDIFTTNDNIFYRISYQEKFTGNILENKNYYKDHLMDIMKLINSIEFYKGRQNPQILDGIEIFSISKQRDFPSFINITDLSSSNIGKINDTLNFREKYNEFVFENSTIGIKLIYKPSDWYIYDFGGSSIENCYKERCHLLMQSINGFTFIDFRSIPPNEYLEICNCTNIYDYIKSIYDVNFGDKSDWDYQFVNDNLTLIDNHTAIQLEFIGKKGSPSENSHSIFLYTQVGDIFYNFDYLIEDEVYRINLPEVKKIIDSVKFIEMDKPKRPSFM